jgi:hypothetical protein
VKGSLPQDPNATHSTEETLENKNNFDALKEDEAQEPEATTRKTLRQTEAFWIPLPQNQ